MMEKARTCRSLVGASALLGCGLGAFFDGILLHQILQWHNMLSNVEPPLDLISMKYNMLWDGVFHAAAWLITVAGVVRLWWVLPMLHGERYGAGFGGGVLLGWGAFNVVEGLVDHQWLSLHHVHPGAGQLAWDLAFLAWGGAMLLAGIRLVRSPASTRVWSS
jgi:uncharacterized membrane protein